MHARDGVRSRVRRGPDGMLRQGGRWEGRGGKGGCYQTAGGCAAAGLSYSTYHPSFTHPSIYPSIHITSHIHAHAHIHTFHLVLCASFVPSAAEVSGSSEQREGWRSL